MRDLIARWEKEAFARIPKISGECVQPCLSRVSRRVLRLRGYTSKLLRKHRVGYKLYRAGVFVEAMSWLSQYVRITDILKRLNAKGVVITRKTLSACKKNRPNFLRVRYPYVLGRDSQYLYMRVSKTHWLSFMASRYTQQQCWVRLDRALLALSRQRLLSADEKVVHKDGNLLNNDLTNLVLHSPKKQNSFYKKVVDLFSKKYATHSCL